MKLLSNNEINGINGGLVDDDIDSILNGCAMVHMCTFDSETSNLLIERPLDKVFCPANSTIEDTIYRRKLVSPLTSIVMNLVMIDYCINPSNK